MKSRELMELAMLVANDFELFARQHDLAPEELLTAVVMTERLISRMYPGTPELLRETVFAAQATFDALTLPPELNERN
jgi:hypothetical protein